MDALTMGGYGVYVWSSFGLMFFAVIASAVQARARHRRTLTDTTRRIKAREASK
jgi:heme exporter protein CcmD